MITSKDLATKVKEMRQAQNEFFRSKTYVSMDRAKRLEREVDNMVNECLKFVDATPGNLFDQPK